MVTALLLCGVCAGELVGAVEAKEFPFLEQPIITIDTMRSILGKKHGCSKCKVKMACLRKIIN
ncbi:MAG: hypothetical protein JSR44_11335 [Spirochaetes bacterium]|nr:hypothetical protein [Spirochaetota bacterium]